MKKICILIAVLAATVLLCCGVMANAAEPDIWDGTVATGFASGTGTEADPYIIETPEQLAYLASSVNAGTTYAGKYIQLANDIYLNDTTNWENWDTTAPANTWTAIGTWDYPFQGTFDGKSFEISGIYINVKVDYQGLFGSCMSSTIQNIGVVESYIKGRVRVGGIVGDNSCGTIIDCYNSGTVIGTRQCVGGIVGSNESGNDNAATVSGSYNMGMVSGDGWVGGVVGYNKVDPDGTATVSRCYNIGTISGDGYVGGVVAYNENKVTHCYNKGSVSSTGSYAGGVIGYNTSNYAVAEVNDCYNTGNISGTSCVGGVVGYNYPDNRRIIIVSNCYNSGTVIGTRYNVGGVVGQNDGGTITASYYLAGCAKDGKNTMQYGIGNVTVGQTTEDLDSSTKGLSNSEMKLQASFVGFDFDTVWAIDSSINSGYPYLQTPIVEGISGGCTWIINANGVLTIFPTNGVSGTLAKMSSFDLFPWNGYSEDITKVVVKPGVIALADSSRMFCLENCKSMDLSGLNTSNVTDMSKMFLGCYYLTELDVSGFNTAKVTDMSEMFSGCYYLTDLDVSGFDTSNVTDMSMMFSSCSSLTKLDVSGFNTAKVTDMNGMFSLCLSVTELDVSGFNTAKVTDMSDMFSYCSYYLNELDVSGFDTSKVTNMSMMFYSCQLLTELDVSNFDTSSVTDMSSMFSYCIYLTELDVSNFDTSNVTDMTGMFDLCDKLMSITVSESFVTTKISNSSYLPKLPNTFYFIPKGTIEPNGNTYTVIQSGVAGTYVIKHNTTYTAAKTPNCKESGNIEYWHCADCNKYFSNEAGTSEIIGDVTLPKAPSNHIGGTEVRNAATESCSTPGYTGDTYCLGCGAKISTGTSIPATGAHIDADGDWESNSTHHWHTCSCDAEFDKTTHSGGTATCKDKAICEICQTPHGDKNPDNHIGGTEVRDAVEAGCVNDGYSGDVWCLGCETIIERGEAIPAYGVTLTGTITTSSTFTAPATLRLLDATGTEVATTSTSDSTYTLTAALGTYTLEVSKKNHVTRTYSVTLSADTTLDVEIHLIGDITGDGKVTIADYGKILNHCKRIATLDGYALTCADVNGDGRVTIADYGKVLNHCKRIASLWEEESGGDSGDSGDGDGDGEVELPMVPA